MDDDDELEALLREFRLWGDEPCEPDRDDPPPRLDDLEEWDEWQ